MVINDWKACYFFFIAVVFYRLLFSIQSKCFFFLCASVSCAYVFPFAVFRSAENNTFTPVFPTDQYVSVADHCSHSSDRDTCLAECIFNSCCLLATFGKQRTLIPLLFCFSFPIVLFFALSILFIYILSLHLLARQVELFRWAVSVSHHYLEMLLPNGKNTIKSIQHSLLGESTNVVNV